MKYNRITLYGLFLVLLVSVSACQEERPYDLERGETTTQTGSEGVITLTTNSTDGVLSLAVDAPREARPAVWLDLNGDGQRAKDQSEDVKQFNTKVEYKVPAGVQKISIFGDITFLAAPSNRLTNVDVSKNRFLKVLHLPMNQLQEVNLTNNSALKVVDLSDNSLERIDLSANTALESAWLYKNKLTELTLENNRALQSLDCSNNLLTQLDVSGNTDLRELLVFNNHLTSLNVKQNSLLNKLWAFGNQFTDTEVANLISSLGKTSNGKLWVSQEPLADHLVKQATSKGWHIE